MKIRCLIVDDEALARQVVKKYLEDLNEFEIVAECKNAIEAIDCLNRESVDLIFLDINMPKLSGLSFLKTLQNPPIVILTTAYREYALEAYELAVIDYLNKPFSFERFLKAINRAKMIFESKQNLIETKPTQEGIKSDFIFIKADKKTHRISFSNIIYIEALGDYIKIHTEDSTIVTYMSLKKIEAILPPSLFPRIHKSYIISLEKTVSIEGNMVEIANEKITIGSSYRKNFFNLIKSHSA
jgi:DNA-binding LytR/AlgR family response regulator